MSDKSGEYFDIRVPQAQSIELQTLGMRPPARHLLLLVRGGDVGQERYLCGHDERHWFASGVPGSASTIAGAMRCLRPPEVEHLVQRRVKRAKNALRRRNEAFVRQGEWFFVPQAELDAPASLILRHEPLSRGDGGKSHCCEELFRDGGVPVYVCQKYPRGLAYDAYARVLERNADAKNWNWRVMRLNARVFARGKISHPDHKTIVLRFWHQVLMNNEHRRGVVFLD